MLTRISSSSTSSSLCLFLIFFSSFLTLGHCDSSRQVKALTKDNFIHEVLDDEAVWCVLFTPRASAIAALRDRFHQDIYVGGSDSSNQASVNSGSGGSFGLSHVDLEFDGLVQDVSLEFSKFALTSQGSLRFGSVNLETFDGLQVAHLLNLLDLSSQFFVVLFHSKEINTDPQSGIPLYDLKLRTEDYSVFLIDFLPSRARAKKTEGEDFNSMKYPMLNLGGRASLVGSLSSDHASLQQGVEKCLRDIHIHPHIGATASPSANVQSRGVKRLSKENMDARLPKDSFGRIVKLIR